MLTWIAKFVAGEFIQGEIAKVKVELNNLVKQLVEDAVKEAMSKIQNPPK